MGLFLLGIFKIFPGNHQHSEAFAMIFPQMFMVHFMRSSNGFSIAIVGISEQFKTLMNKNIMNGKIGDAVSKYTQSYCQSDFQDAVLPKQEKRHADNGVNHKKSIIVFKPRIVCFMMMIFVQAPQKTVHDVLVTKPGHEFHQAEGEQKNQNMYPHSDCF